MEREAKVDKVSMWFFGLDAMLEEPTTFDGEACEPAPLQGAFAGCKRLQVLLVGSFGVKCFWVFSFWCHIMAILFGTEDIRAPSSSLKSDSCLWTRRMWRSLGSLTATSWIATPNLVCWLSVAILQRKFGLTFTSWRTFLWASCWSAWSGSKSNLHHLHHLHPLLRNDFF